MKNSFPLLASLILLPLLSILYSPTSVNGQQATETATISSSNPVEVFYFHRNRRCASCHNIEKLTKQAVETQYAKELENGSVVLRIVNIETEANKELAEKYKVSGVALIVASDNGEEKISTNFTAMAYRFARNEDQFASELKKVIDQTMNN